MSATQWVGLTITFVAWVWTIGMAVSAVQASRRRRDAARAALKGGGDGAVDLVRLRRVLGQHRMVAEHTTHELIEVMCTCGWSFTARVCGLPEGREPTDAGLPGSEDLLAEHVGTQLHREGVI